MTGGLYAVYQKELYCRKSETRLDFVAVKGLVEQHTVSYRCSGTSLVQALCFRRSALVVASKSDYHNYMHLLSCIVRSVSS